MLVPTVVAVSAKVLIKELGPVIILSTEDLHSQLVISPWLRAEAIFRKH